VEATPEMGGTCDIHQSMHLIREVAVTETEGDLLDIPHTVVILEIAHTPLNMHPIAGENLGNQSGFRSWLVRGMS